MSAPQELVDLAARLVTAFPKLEVSFDGPTKGGWWFMDNRLPGVPTVVVEYRPGQGFGVSRITADTCYGEGADEVIRTIEDVETWVCDALRHQ